MKYRDLDGQQQASIDQMLGDGSNEFVHEAIEGLKDSWSLERREKYAIADNIRKFEKIEPDDELMKDLEARHEDLFVDAAEPGWADA